MDNIKAMSLNPDIESDDPKVLAAKFKHDPPKDKLDRLSLFLSAENTIYRLMR